jgi:AraC-like DNA-binding protein
MIGVFYIGSMFCALVTVYILLFKNVELRDYSKILLCIFFLLHVWCVIIYLAIYYGWIIYLPHLFKTAAPINYLLPPLTYLYVRVVLFNEKKFTIKDSWHLIPFVIFLINYMPFYFLPVSTKTEVLLEITRDFSYSFKYQSGLLPEFYALLIRILQTFLYLIFQWRLIINFKNGNNNIEIMNQIKDVLEWLRIYTWASTLFIISIVLSSVLFIFIQSSSIFNVIIQFPIFLIAVSFFAISTFLLVNPNVLLGLPFINHHIIESKLQNGQVLKYPFIAEDYSKEISSIITYFKENEPYLNKGVNISQISVATGIPVKQLSFIMNNHFKQRFNDFINQHRIEYITKKINQGYLDHYTLQTLSSEAGFTSPTTFIAAFKKIELCSPSEYLIKSKR